jgi:hypothetical protein
MKTTKHKSKTPKTIKGEKRKKPAEEPNVIPTDRPERRWPERSDEEAIGRPIQLEHDPRDRDVAKRSGRDSR